MSVSKIGSLRAQIAKLATRLSAGAMSAQEREALRVRKLQLSEDLWAAEIEAASAGWRLQPARVQRRRP